MQVKKLLAPMRAVIDFESVSFLQSTTIIDNIEAEYIFIL
jgi:hypothetical protein